MLSAEDNEPLTQTGASTPMGELLRRYRRPVAGEAELDRKATKRVRLLGEDLAGRRAADLLSPTMRIAFDHFEYGSVKRRLREGDTEESDDWKYGHAAGVPRHGPAPAARWAAAPALTSACQRLMDRSARAG